MHAVLNESQTETRISRTNDQIFRQISLIEKENLPPMDRAHILSSFLPFLF